MEERRGPAIEPREIMQDDDSSLRITWGDEFIAFYSAPNLRRVCPCAQCVNEWTGQRTLIPETISDNIQFTDIEIVGRYALNFKFSDRHETGIYSFRYLREIGESVNPDSGFVN
jgi:DUF971 family protein